ncbi:MAG: phosphoglucosamine mutase [Planctomycetes bacterium]|nr:phosphoglucosamine mutase [Planctomycetota bacterium]
MSTKSDSPESFQPPRFGTDGLRGRAGEPPLDPETLRRVGAALGMWVQRSGPERKRVLVGNDGRESAMWILEALAQGLATADCSTVDIGLTTTPALAWLARHEPVVAGIMISASHNPAHDNGVKIFDHSGHKLPDEAEREIEALTATLEFAEIPLGRASEDTRVLDRYVEELANRFAHVDLTGATVVVDGANGGGSELAPIVLRGLGADVVRVACEPDGFNINDGCGSLHPESIRDIVRQSGAVLGICLDGDGDRSIFVDDRGDVHDGDDLLATLGPHLLAAGRLPHATVVGTIMSNLGLRRVLREAGVQLEMTPVGDRHVARRMREGGFRLGAEQSGHVLFDLDGHFVGDALHTALTVLSLPGVVRNGSAQAFRSFTRYPQRLVNIAVSAKPPLDTVGPLQDACRRIEADLGEEGRVVLRYSGTEPLCRVMVEAPTHELVDRSCDELAGIVRRELGA